MDAGAAGALGEAFDFSDRGDLATFSFKSLSEMGRRASGGGHWLLTDSPRSRGLVLGRHFG